MLKWYLIIPTVYMERLMGHICPVRFERVKEDADEIYASVPNDILEVYDLTSLKQSFICAHRQSRAREILAKKYETPIFFMLSR
jgi:hypothetical protein